MKEKIKNWWGNIKKEKLSPILLILVVVNTVAMLISNIIAAKTFPLFTIESVDLTVVLPCAVIIFPITYIASDVFSEVYGYKWTRRTAWISFVMNLIMVAFFEIAIVMPGTTDLSVLHSTWFLLLASLIAYMFGDFMNDIVFVKMKKKHGERGFIGRAALSSFVVEFCDSAIYIPLGMALLPTWILGFPFMTWAQVGLCVIIQPLFKVCYELIVSPITFGLSKKLKQLEKDAGNSYEL